MATQGVRTQEVDLVYPMLWQDGCWTVEKPRIPLRGRETQYEVQDSQSWFGGGVPGSGKRPGPSGSQILLYLGTTGYCGRAENRWGPLVWI